MKRRIIIIIILLSILLDVQRVSAATTPNFHTVIGDITSISGSVIYLGDSKHIIIGVNENV